MEDESHVLRWSLEQQLSEGFARSLGITEVRFPFVLMEDALRFLFTQQRLQLADNVSLVTHSAARV